MFFNIGKIVINYNSKLLSFSQNEFNFLLIQGFFGPVSLKIPKNVFIQINQKNFILYFDLNKLFVIKKFLKSFYFLIIFSCHGLVFNHFVYMNIKGIGRKFKFEKKLEKNFLIVYNGNSLPTYFEMPDNLKIKIKVKSGPNSLIVFCGDFILLNNFIAKIRNIAKPNKYKEIGVYLKKKL